MVKIKSESFQVTLMFLYQMVELVSTYTGLRVWGSEGLGFFRSKGPVVWGSEGLRVWGSGGLLRTGPTRRLYQPVSGCRIWLFVLGDVDHNFYTSDNRKHFLHRFYLLFHHFHSGFFLSAK